MPFEVSGRKLAWVEKPTRPVPMDKLDLKRAYKELSTPTAKDFVLVDGPAFRYLMVDCHGTPGGSQTYVNALTNGCMRSSCRPTASNSMAGITRFTSTIPAALPRLG